MFSDDQRKALLGGIQTACRLFWGPDDSHCQEMKQNGLFNELAPSEPILRIHPPDTLRKLNKMIVRYEDSRMPHSIHWVWPSSSVSYSLWVTPIDNRKKILSPLGSVSRVHRFEFLGQRFPIDTQNLGGPGFVAGNAFQHIPGIFCFNLFQSAV